MSFRTRFAAMDDRAARRMGIGIAAGFDSPAVIPWRFVIASVTSMIAVLTGALPAMFVLALGGGGSWLAWLYISPPVASFVAVITYARGSRTVGIITAVLCAIPPLIGVIFGDHAWHGDLGWAAVYGIGFVLQALGVVLCLPRWDERKASAAPATDMP